MTALAPSLRRLRDADTEDLAALARLLTGFLTDTSNAIGGAIALGNMRVVLHTIDVTMPDRWTAPTLGGTWADYGSGYASAGYSKDASGVVRLRGVLAGGTYGATPIFTLPAGFRPSQSHTFPAAQSSVFEPAGFVTVSSTGDVTAPEATSVQEGVSTFLSLDGITFDADGDGAPSQPGTPFPFSLSTGGITGRLNVVVFGCEDWTGRAVQAAPYPRISWAISGTVIRVYDLDGLVPGRRYKVRIAAFGE